MLLKLFDSKLGFNERENIFGWLGVQYSSRMFVENNFISFCFGNFFNCFFCLCIYWVCQFHIFFLEISLRLLLKILYALIQILKFLLFCLLDEIGICFFVVLIYTSFIIQFFLHI